MQRSKLPKAVIDSLLSRAPCVEGGSLDHFNTMESLPLQRFSALVSLGICQSKIQATVETDFRVSASLAVVYVCNQLVLMRACNSFNRSGIEFYNHWGTVDDAAMIPEDMVAKPVGQHASYYQSPPQNVTGGLFL